MIWKTKLYTTAPTQFSRHTAEFQQIITFIQILLEDDTIEKLRVFVLKQESVQIGGFLFFTSAGTNSKLKVAFFKSILVVVDQFLLTRYLRFRKIGEVFRLQFFMSNCKKNLNFKQTNQIFVQEKKILRRGKNYIWSYFYHVFRCRGVDSTQSFFHYFAENYFG